MKKLYFLSVLLTILVSFNSCFDPIEKDTELEEQTTKINEYIKSFYPTYPSFYDVSGIAFVILEFGDLPPARTGQNMQLELTGRVLESTQPFQDELLNTKLENISTEGLRFVLRNVMTGSRVVAFLPSRYAFKEEGNASVPPNAIIQYDFNLISTQLTEDQNSRLATDTLAIKQYVVDNEIEDVFRHPSGLYYKIETLGSGVNPNVYSSVNLKFTGKLLTTNTIFDSGNLSSLLFNLIDGFKIGVPLIKPGGKITLFVPSYLGYGTEPRTGIPANSNLIFEVEFTSVNPTN